MFATLATALCLSEAEVKAMSWGHYKALCAHWVENPPAQMVMAAWLRSVRK